MEPQHKEQEASAQQSSSQEAQSASSGQLLVHQQEPRKPRFSRRALAIAGVGTLGALIIGRQTGILATNEEKQEARLLKRDRALIALEPTEKFDAGYVDRGSAAGFRCTPPTSATAGTCPQPKSMPLRMCRTPFCSRE